MRKRSRFVPLIVLVAAVGAAYWSADPFGQRAGPKAPPERPFVELEAAVALYIENRWEIAAPPRLPGPYRESREGAMGCGARSKVTCRLRDDSGAVTEDLQLEPDPEFDRTVMCLDTASGGRTLVVLRRPHKP